MDEDGDGYPNVLLESCADLSSDQRNVSYCIPVSGQSDVGTTV